MFSAFKVGESVESLPSASTGVVMTVGTGVPLMVLVVVIVFTVEVLDDSEVLSGGVSEVGLGSSVVVSCLLVVVGVGGSVLLLSSVVEDDVVAGGGFSVFESSVVDELLSLVSSFDDDDDDDESVVVGSAGSESPVEVGAGMTEAISSSLISLTAVLWAAITVTMDSE